jgi:hypothetical protein
MKVKVSSVSWSESIEVSRLNHVHARSPTPRHHTLALSVSPTQRPRSAATTAVANTSQAAAPSGRRRLGQPLTVFPQVDDASGHHQRLGPPPPRATAADPLSGHRCLGLPPPLEPPPTAFPQAAASGRLLGPLPPPTPRATRGAACSSSLVLVLLPAPLTAARL